MNVAKYMNVFLCINLRYSVFIMKNFDSMF